MSRAEPPPKENLPVSLPEAPALVLSPGQAVWLSSAGEIEQIALPEAARRLAAELVPDALGPDSWTAFTNAVKEKTGAKGKALFMPLRLALTGRERGPEMAVIFPLIGAEKARARLRGERA